MSPAIDIPIEGLPYVDEHAIGIWASDREVWDALLAIVPRVMDNRFARGYGPLVGIEHESTNGDFGSIGSTIPEKTATGATLRAETRAEFPGVKGRAYKAMVIDTRMHVLLVRRILAAVKKQAERGSAG